MDNDVKTLQRFVSNLQFAYLNKLKGDSRSYLFFITIYMNLFERLHNLDIALFVIFDVYKESGRVWY